MSTYIPAFETQRDESAPLPWTNCNPASMAMLIDLWTYGQINTSDVAIRAASSVPLNRGMNFPEVGAAVVKLFPVLEALRYSESHATSPAPISWGQLLTILAEGGGAVVCGNYGDAGFRNSKGLGEWKSTTGLRLDRWQPAGTFGHAMFACDFRRKSAGGDDTYLHMDPLGHGEYRGDRAPIGALWDFIWKSGWTNADVRITAAHGFTQERAQPVRFGDVPRTHPFYGDIEWLASEGLTGGTKFYPESPLTRGQFAALLHRYDERVVKPRTED